MLERIYITRHGFRANWETDASGNYKTSFDSPTGIPNDPPLTAHGVEQAREMATFIASLPDDRKPDVIYSSPFYRCLQTIEPTVEKLGLGVVRVENGIGEWFGKAPFTHPAPGTRSFLKTFYSFVDDSNDVHIITPSLYGEMLAEVHDRVAYAIMGIIHQLDQEPGAKNLLICAHAATVIALGRALTGDKDLDVRAGTCSFSSYSRPSPAIPSSRPPPITAETPVPDVNWRGNGIFGKWKLEINGDCSFLKNGEERNWGFVGEEAWDFPVKKDGGQESLVVDKPIEANSLVEKGKI